MMLDFSGKRVLVTGGSRGIGAATALAFRARGAEVAVGARSLASFEAFVARHGDDGFRPAIGEVRHRAAAHAVVEAALDLLGGLDVLVSSAGVFEEIPIAEVTQQHWDETLAVNLGGVFFCAQAALPALEAASGNIVNVASDAGLIGYPNGAVYSASKGGVVNLTRAMAVELAPRVRVNCVCPGNVETDMIASAAQASGEAARYLDNARRRSPWGRMARPQEVAAAILYLASDDAGFTSGTALAVDGAGTAGF
jgi:NAD(P)-dependent dehydrogenase (short-subunit alcohol dehydrogenase family)